METQNLTLGQYFLNAADQYEPQPLFFEQNGSILGALADVSHGVDSALNVLYRCWSRDALHDPCRFWPQS